MWEGSIRAQIVAEILGQADHIVLKGICASTKQIRADLCQHCGQLFQDVLKFTVLRAPGWQGVTSVDFHAFTAWQTSKI